jgi:CHAD domain-containing protein
MATIAHGSDTRPAVQNAATEKTHRTPVRGVEEVERKYEPPAKRRSTAAPVLPSLSEVPGVAAVREEPARSLDALYYDTPDLRLAAAGITLRYRTGDGPGEDGWHLKLPLGGDTREELHVSDPRDRSARERADGERADVPRTLTSLLRSRTRDRALVPAVRIRTARRPRTLRAADGTVLAEVCVDQVTADVSADPQGTPEAAALPVEWAEVEVELGPGGDPALLDAVEERLTADGGLRRSSAPSKLARALRGRLTTSSVRPRTTPRKPAGRSRTAAPTSADVVLAYLAAQARALIELDPAVRRRLPDAVHRMRVAARRLRSTLRSYGSVLDPGATAIVVDELRLLGAELGAERDQEVRAERLRAAAAELPRPLVLGPVRGRIRTWDTARRSGARRRATAALDSPRHLALLDRLDALLAEPPLREPAAHRPAPKRLHKVLAAEYRRVAERIEHALALPAGGEERETALHEARKAAKRARYAAETAMPALGAPAKRYRGAMRDLQELLGEHHDSAASREALHELAVQAHKSGENAFTFGVLHQREAERAAAAEEALPALWERVREAAAEAVS